MWVVSLLAIPVAAVSNPIQQYALKESEEQRNLLGLGRIGATKDFSSPIHPHVHPRVLKESGLAAILSKTAAAEGKNEDCLKIMGGCQSPKHMDRVKDICKGYCELKDDTNAAAKVGMCAGAFALGYCNKHKSWINEKCKREHERDEEKDRTANYCDERKIRLYINSSEFHSDGQYRDCKGFNKIQCRGQEYEGEESKISWVKKTKRKCTWNSEEKSCHVFTDDGAGHLYADA